MNSHLVRVSSIIAVMAALAGFAQAQQLKFKTCRKPLPLQLKPFTHQPQRIDFLCGNNGCNKGAANNLQNAMKNNYCAPANQITTVTLDTFKDLNEASNNEPSIPKGTPPSSRAKLKNIITLGNGKKLGEGKVVTFVAYVLEARHSNVDKDHPLSEGNGESVQCNLLGCVFNDIHITLAEDPNEQKMCRTITAEIIPHFRPPAWDLFDSPDYASFLKTHPVKITGQLFFDGSHVACTADGQAGLNPTHNNQPDFKRLALWEIHPIFAIHVCKHTELAQCRAGDASAWFPFSQLKSKLGLTAVTPMERCRATTNNPKSKCPGFTLPARRRRPNR